MPRQGGEIRHATSAINNKNVSTNHELEFLFHPFSKYGKSITNNLSNGSLYFSAIILVPFGY